MTTRRTSRQKVTELSSQARRLLISGHVQGVGFRYSMLHAARRFGANGWVRNTRTGDVEAVVQGPMPIVEMMIEWSRTGPEGARVDNVDVSETTGTFLGFEIRDTV